MVLNPEIAAMRRSSEEIKNILFGGGDDRVFYKVVLSVAFRELKSFEVRQDIEVPKEVNDGGVVLSFDDGRMGYFKIQSDPLSDDEFESILSICYSLQDKFGGSVEAYVLCRPEIKLRAYGGIQRDDITVRLATLKSYDSDEIVEKLEDKRKNKVRFTFEDCIHHMLLPYMGYKDKDVFLPKYQRYMMETMFDNAERHGIKVFRL